MEIIARKLQSLGTSEIQFLGGVVGERDKIDLCNAVETLYQRHFIKKCQLPGQADP